VLLPNGIDCFLLRALERVGLTAHRVLTTGAGVAMFAAVRYWKEGESRPCCWCCFETTGVKLRGWRGIPAAVEAYVSGKRVP